MKKIILPVVALVIMSMTSFANGTTQSISISNVNVLGGSACNFNALFSATAQLTISGTFAPGSSLSTSASIDSCSVTDPDLNSSSATCRVESPIGTGLPDSFLGPVSAGTYSRTWAFTLNDNFNGCLYSGRNTGSIPYTINSTPALQPALQLSGRSAFLKSLATPVFAQQEERVNIIADVNVTSAQIVKEAGRLYTLSTTLESKQGTQPDTLVGVQVIRKDTKELLDEFALITPLILMQDIPKIQEFTYILPAHIAGELEFYVYTKTQKGILLGALLAGTRTVSASPSTVVLSPCTLVGTTLSCTLTNTTKTLQTVVLGTQVNKGNSLFGAFMNQTPPATRALKANETISYTQIIPATTHDIFTNTFLAQDGTLLYRSAVTRKGTINAVSINNVLINQIGKKTYEVTVVSLDAPFAKMQNLTLETVLTGKDGTCVSVQTPLVVNADTPNTSFALSVPKACAATSLTTTLVDAQGTVIDTYTTPYTNTFIPEPRNWLFPLLALIAIVCVGLFVVLRKRA